MGGELVKFFDQVCPCELISVNLASDRHPIELIYMITPYEVTLYLKDLA